MFRYSIPFSALTDPSFTDEDLLSCDFIHEKLVRLEKQRKSELSNKARFTNLVNENRRETIYVKRSHIKVVPVESRTWRDRTCN